MGVIDTAKSYIGKVRYVFGGDDLDNGVADCSSFVQTVFRKNGVSIGRTTFDQIEQGTPVDKKDLQAGDLVFFQGTYATSGPSHVGIYIGGSQFIDCGSTGVRISDLNSSYWQEHYMTARRIPNTPVGDGVVTGNFSSNATITSGSSGSGIFGSIAIFGLIILCVVCGMFFLSMAFGFSLNPLS